MSITVPLRKPITAHGETVNSLTLREPRGKDIAACGNARSYIQRGKSVTIVINAEVVYDYIVALADIPPSSVDQLSAADWNDVQNAVLSFFSQAETGEASAPIAAKQAPDDGQPKRVPMPTDLPGMSTSS